MGNKRLQNGGKEREEKHVAEKGSELYRGNSERGRWTSIEGQGDRGEEKTMGREIDRKIKSLKTEQRHEEKNV